MRNNENILKENGYISEFKSNNYINRNTKTIFSSLCCRDMSEQWLLDRISEVNDTGGWRVYLCSILPRSNEDYDQLIAELRETLSTNEQFIIHHNEERKIIM